RRLAVPPLLEVDEAQVVGGQGEVGTELESLGELVLGGGVLLFLVKLETTVVRPLGKLAVRGGDRCGGSDPLLLTLQVGNGHPRRGPGGIRLRLPLRAMAPGRKWGGLALRNPFPPGSTKTNS